ncbi:MAG: hypothetical protein AAF544_01225 [Bacteroidota bacterium]
MRLHLNAVRNLLVVLLQDLFADDFGHEESLWPVSQLIFWIVGQSFRQLLLNGLTQRIYARSLQSRNGQYLFYIQPFAKLLAQLVDSIRFYRVDFINEQKNSRVFL